MLAIWRLHGFDALLREAWERGVVLAGGSAGMICWFEAALTDSYGPQLEGMRDGLGFLAGNEESGEFADSRLGRALAAADQPLERRTIVGRAIPVREQPVEHHG